LFMYDRICFYILFYVVFDIRIERDGK